MDRKWDQMFKSTHFQSSTMPINWPFPEMRKISRNKLPLSIKKYLKNSHILELVVLPLQGVLVYVALHKIIFIAARKSQTNWYNISQSPAPNSKQTMKFSFFLIKEWERLKLKFIENKCFSHFCCLIDIPTLSSAHLMRGGNCFLVCCCSSEEQLK